MEQTAALWRSWTERRDERSFASLVIPELPHALSFARRIGCSADDAEDALQEALVRLAAARDGTPARLGLAAAYEQKGMAAYSDYDKTMAAKD